MNVGPVYVTNEENDMATVVEDYVQMCFSPQEDPPLGQEVRADILTRTISLDDKSIYSITKYRKCKKQKDLIL